MKIIIIIVTVFLLSCSNPVQFVKPDQTSELIGTFSHTGKAFTFFDNGDFSYFSLIDGQEYNYGFYIEYPEDGLLYLEDPLQFVIIWYWYDIGDSLFLCPDGGDWVEWVRE